MPFSFAAEPAAAEAAAATFAAQSASTLTVAAPTEPAAATPKPATTSVSTWNYFILRIYITMPDRLNNITMSKWLVHHTILWPSRQLH